MKKLLLLITLVGFGKMIKVSAGGSSKEYDDLKNRMDTINTLFKPLINAEGEKDSKNNFVAKNNDYISLRSSLPEIIEDFFTIALGKKPLTIIKFKKGDNSTDEFYDIYTKLLKKMYSYIENKQSAMQKSLPDQYKELADITVDLSEKMIKNDAWNKPHMKRYAATLLFTYAINLFKAIEIVLQRNINSFPNLDINEIKGPVTTAEQTVKKLLTKK
jgi:hypothetical protein